VEVLLIWSDGGSVVDVFLDDSPPIEITAPINVNYGPPERHHLDEQGRVSGTGTQRLGVRIPSSRLGAEYGLLRDRVTWTPTAPWA
jgi:hypothetical protein